MEEISNNTNTINNEDKILDKIVQKPTQVYYYISKNKQSPIPFSKIVYI